jgi:hypothetical protein
MMQSLLERFDVCEKIMGEIAVASGGQWRLVTGDAGVDGAGPGVDAAGEGLGVGEALVA